MIPRKRVGSGNACNLRGVCGVGGKTLRPHDDCDTVPPICLCKTGGTGSRHVSQRIISQAEVPD